MKISLMRVGMKVTHSNYGPGVVRLISDTSVDVDFDNGRRSLSAADQDLHPAEPLVSITGGEMPLPDFIRQNVTAILRELGIEKQEEIIEGLGLRWKDGTVILKPADSALQPKEIPLETFFHKIVMMRNNLRVLEQKINGSPMLEEAEKVELQQYITRCYGSMTTFNILFREKDDQF